MASFTPFVVLPSPLLAFGGTVADRCAGDLDVFKMVEAALGIVGGDNRRGLSRAVALFLYMGGCQNYGPFLGTLNIRGRIIIGTQKGATILTTTHIVPHM